MAIAYDSSSAGGPANDTLTYSHTCTGSDLILFVFVDQYSSGNDYTSGVTYNGVSMTRVASRNITNLGEFLSMYVLVNPATGANDIVISSSQAASFRSTAASYTGAKQTGQPDANTTAQSSSAATTFANSITTVADNCWVVEGSRNNQDSASNGTNYVNRANSAGVGIGDTNAVKTPAGSISMTVTTSTAADWGVIQVSFDPLTGFASAGTNSRMTLLGVGI